MAESREDAHAAKTRMENLKQAKVKWTPELGPWIAEVKV
jgi:hypothetical protein